MHCAEKKKYPRYLSALMLSRSQTLTHNVKVFLREKLPKYNIDLEYFFEVRHDDCTGGITNMMSYYDLFIKKQQDLAGSVADLDK